MGVRHTSGRDMSASQGAVPHGHPRSLIEAVSLMLHPQPQRLRQRVHGIIYGILERGYTQSEIGRLVGMAQQNIGRRMKKTIPRLQQHLTAQGYAV